MDYASSLLGLLPGGRRTPGLKELLGSVGDYLPPDQVDAHQEAAEFGASAHHGPEAPVGRTVHRPSGGRGRHPRRPAARRRHHRRRDPARRHRGHPDAEGPAGVALRRRRGRNRRRRHQARPDQVQEPRGGAGGVASARCCWRWCATCASSSSSSPTAPTTCARSRRWRRRGAARSRARRSTSTRRSPSASVSTPSSSSSRTSASRRCTRAATCVLERALKRARGNQKEFLKKIEQQLNAALLKAGIAGAGRARARSTSTASTRRCAASAPR